MLKQKDEHSPLTLRDYQVDDLAFYINNPRCANLSDPGTGKTPSVCVYQEYLWKKKNAKTAWSMPMSLLEKNKEEIHAFTNFHDAEVQIIDGTAKQRLKQIQNPHAKVLLMGFTRFGDDWKTIKEYHPELNAHMVDEIHLGFKGHKSKRTESTFKAMRKLDYFLAMSGTLIDGRLDSCYPTIKIIEPRYYANHYSFMMQHAVMDEYNNVLTWMNHDKLGRIFQRHCIRRTLEDVYGSDTTKPIVQTEWCSMHPKQREAYNEFEATAVLELEAWIEAIENDILEGFEPGVQTIRCRQIMAHPETFDILKGNQKTGKDEALLVHIEDHIRKDLPLIIYAALQPEQERITKLCQEAGLETALINGNVSASKRANIDRAFRSGDLDCVVASPQTASVGFNWGHVDHIIFASIDYSNVNFVQAYRRAIRGVREKLLRVTVLGYRNSIDEKQFHIVNAKSRHLNKVDSSYEILELGKKV